MIYYPRRMSAKIGRLSCITEVFGEFVGKKRDMAIKF